MNKKTKQAGLKMKDIRGDCFPLAREQEDVMGNQYVPPHLAFIAWVGY